jgi:DNA (cytosine-5)-methyltransferase 1
MQSSQPYRGMRTSIPRWGSLTTKEGESVLTHFSLFTGIGGIDLSAEWAGFTTVGQVEWADYPTKVLEKHWPNVPRWRDVRDVTAESVRNRGIGEITLLSGGFPCQPHSVAGKRKASADDRDLWPEYRRIISEVRPKWVLAENVPGLLSSEDGRFFRGILRDLSQLGFNVGWCTYPACWVGAVHRRERIFVIAYSNIKYVERSGIKKIQRFKVLQSQLYARGIKEWARRCEIYQPKLCRYFNGIPGQVDRLKCLGNAVVPQQVYPILAAIAEIERR